MAEQTSLYQWHVAQGARMVDFAGFDMPVQYPAGVLKEHLHCRAQAGLFDVSHMGQAWLRPQAGENIAALMEELVPAGITSLAEGAIRYTMLTTPTGGIYDDLMVTRFGDDLWLVVNAACKQQDFSYISERLSGRAILSEEKRALLALQGPQARAILSKYMPQAAELTFMTAQWCDWQGHAILMSCCGYTGEDGFEISLPEAQARDFADMLIETKEVMPIGLGARDSLRLEAGLCLYGHDIDKETTPVEAALCWTIPKRRRETGGFAGAEVILPQFTDGSARKRVGIIPDGKAIAREGADILSPAGDIIGQVTSGGFAPSCGHPIAMGYVQADYAAPDQNVQLLIRGKAHPATITNLPFIKHQYYKGT